MAKYDWNQLEQEYMLGDYRSASAFLKEKGIPRNGSVQQSIKGWNAKKVQLEKAKSSKTIEKIIEKQSEKNAEQAIKVNDVANKLLSKIAIASDELDKGMDMFGRTHQAEILNRADIKKLSSALKDISDILSIYNSDEIEDTSETDKDIYG